MSKPVFIRRRLLPQPLHHFQALGLVALLILAFWTPTARAIPQSQAESSTTLTSGVAIESQLSNGQIQVYQFALSASELAKIDIDVKKINLTVSLIGSDGRVLVEKKITHQTVRTDFLLWEAQSAGSYRLKVVADDKDPALGKYILKVSVFAASEQQSQAYRQHRETERLHRESLAARKLESLNRAIKAYQEATQL